MAKDKNKEKEKIITKVLTTQAQNIFGVGLYNQIKTVLRAIQLNNLDEMIKAALEEEQALGNFKPKYESKNTNTFMKPKYYNCEG